MIAIKRFSIRMRLSRTAAKKIIQSMKFSSLTFGSAIPPVKRKTYLKLIVNVNSGISWKNKVSNGWLAARTWKAWPKAISEMTRTRRNASISLRTCIIISTMLDVISKILSSPNSLTQIHKINSAWLLRIINSSSMLYSSCMVKWITNKTKIMLITLPASDMAPMQKSIFSIFFLFARNCSQLVCYLMK